MPRPRKQLDLFKADIQSRIAGGQSYKDICQWLAAKGVQISKNTLSTRVIEWQGKATNTASKDPTLVSAVNTAFHMTLHDDQTIADNITASDTSTMHR